MSGERITDSAFTVRPPIKTEVCVAFRAPVAKIVKRRVPLLGSNGPSCKVSLFRITPSPIPSPVLVKTPGAVRSVGTVPREEKFSAFVTITSAFPNSVWGGARKLTCPGETKKICAARPLTVTLVPATFVGKLPLGRRCAWIVVFASTFPWATAMLSGATALIAEGSWLNDAPLRIAVKAPNAGRAGTVVT